MYRASTAEAGGYNMEPPVVWLTITVCCWHVRPANAAAATTGVADRDIYTGCYAAYWAGSEAARTPDQACSSP